MNCPQVSFVGGPLDGLEQVWPERPAPTVFVPPQNPLKRNLRFARSAQTGCAVYVVDERGMDATVLVYRYEGVAA